MSDAGSAPPQMEGGAPGSPAGPDSRSERRSVRRRAKRKRRAGRLFSAVAPATAVIVVVAVLFPLLVSPGQGEEAEGATTASAATSGATTTTTTIAPISPGGALLVIEQDGAAMALALVVAGPRGGVVLGLPGVTLLRSGDRFTQLVRLHVPDKPQAIAQPVMDALAVPVGAVASVKWSELRAALASEGTEPLPPLQLDAKDGNAAQVAEALAAAFGERVVDGGEPVWQGLPLAGDGDGFRAAIGAALLAGRGTGWVGQALSGTLVENGDLTYLEPDIKTARSVLAGTGAGG